MATQSSATDPDTERRLYASLISSTPDLVYAFDRNYLFTFANKALLEMWDRTPEQSVGKTLLEVGYEPWHAEMHEREIDQVIATGEPVRGEVGFPHATLGWRIYDYILTPVFDAKGEVEWIGGTTRDITEIKRAEDHLRLLVNELNHRVKNTLATVQSLAAQSFRDDRARPDARKDFDGRLIALSNAHSVLTKTNWEAAGLREIAEVALEPFRKDFGGCDRIAIDGVDIRLRPQAALGFAMALHELATNAVRYGALSTDDGTLSLAWRVEDDRLNLSWREEGGPPVASPAQRGFGSRLIEQALARDLGGSAEIAFLPEGVVCTFDVPIHGGPDPA